MYLPLMFNACLLFLSALHCCNMCQKGDGTYYNMYHFLIDDFARIIEPGSILHFFTFSNMLNSVHMKCHCHGRPSVL